MFLGYALIDSEQDLRRFFMFNAILILLVSCPGIAQSITGSSFLNPSTIQEDIRDLSTLYRTSRLRRLPDSPYQKGQNCRLHHNRDICGCSADEHFSRRDEVVFGQFPGNYGRFRLGRSVETKRGDLRRSFEPARDLARRSCYRNPRGDLSTRG